ncbi:MAG: AMP-binding protein [Anaerolineae bacterium]
MNRTPLEAWIAAKIGQSKGPLTRSALEVYQGNALVETVTWARQRSRFYRHTFAKLPPISGLSDLTQLPFTTAEDLCRDPLQFVCVSQDDIQRVVTLDTTGTTGSPKRLYFTKADQELTTDFFHHGMTTFTDPGDRVLILLPGQTPGSVGDLLAVALKRFGAVPVKYGPVINPLDTIEVIRRESIDVIVGVPVHLLSLVRCDPSLRLKSVLFATDHVSDPIRAALERAWGCQTFDHYGMTEMGLGGGVECEARRGYHLREADLLFEVIDPLNGTPVADGVYGEIVFTTLTRRGMPLIRYRTGDWGRFIPGKCLCGAALRTLERVGARVKGRIALNGGSSGILTIGMLDHVLFAHPAVVNYAAALSCKDAREVLTLTVQSNDPQLNRGRLAALLFEAMPFMTKVALDISFTESMPLTMAKRVLLDRREGCP